VVTDYTYNLHGLLTRIKTGNKVALSHGGNDEKGGVNKPELGYNVDSAFLNYRYAYDNKGLMISRSESVVNRLETYEYDNLDRLTGITSGKIGQTGVLQTFSYSKNGNISNHSKDVLINYINKQQEHHQKENTHDELMCLWKENGMEIDARYFM